MSELKASGSKWIVCIFSASSEHTQYTSLGYNYSGSHEEGEVFYWRGHPGLVACPVIDQIAASRPWYGTDQQFALSALSSRYQGLHTTWKTCPLNNDYHGGNQSYAMSAGDSPRQIVCLQEWLQFVRADPSREGSSVILTKYRPCLQHLPSPTSQGLQTFLSNYF